MVVDEVQYHESYRGAPRPTGTRLISAIITVWSGMHFVRYVEGLSLFDPFYSTLRIHFWHGRKVARTLASNSEVMSIQMGEL